MYKYNMSISKNNANIEELKKMAKTIAMNDNAMKQVNVIPPLNTHAKQPMQKPVGGGNVPQQRNPQSIMKQQAKSVQIKDSNTSEDVSNIVQINQNSGDDGNIVLNDNSQNIDNALIQNSGMFCIMGINIPKSTLYLTVILILIAAVIWYISGDRQRKKNKNDENE